MVKLTVFEMRQHLLAACMACGASERTAASLTNATVSADWNSRAEMGCAHLLDYLDGFLAGRIDGRAEPTVHHPLPAIIHVDGNRGIAQLGFDNSLDDLAGLARTFGIALFSQKNTYTAGELGYYARRLAGHGLVALAMANSHAMMATRPGSSATYGTNPIAFGAPRLSPNTPLVFDQATSATAFVNLVRAKAGNETIPLGWAVDEDGVETTDPARAMLGALLPSGGRKGANLALMIEVLGAGLAGGSWSLDAGHFQSGHECPSTGMTILAIAPDAIDPDFAERLEAQLDRLASLGVHIPGSSAPDHSPTPTDEIEIKSSTWAEILRYTRQ